MAAANKIKLFKIASEINIGKDAIVEFLQSKGFSIENKPTATLDEAMLQAINDKFKREKAAAEKQREKLQKQKDLRVTTQARDTKFKSEETLEISSLMHEEAVPKQEPTVPMESIEEIEREEAYETEPVQTIEIETMPPSAMEIAEAPLEETITDAAAEIQRTVETNPIIGDNHGKTFEKFAESSIDEAYEDAVDALTMSRLDDSEATIVSAEDIIIDKIDRSLQEERESASREASEPVEEIIPAAAATEAASAPAASTEEELEAEHRRKKKNKKKILEVTPGEAPKLRGLTVIGKIDLDANKKKDKPVGDKRDKKKRKFGKPERLPESDTLATRPKERPFRRPEGGPGHTGPGHSGPGHSGQGHTGPGAGQQRQPASASLRDTASTPGRGPLPIAGGAPKPKEADKFDATRKKKRKKSIREQISQEEVDKAIRQTLSGMEVSNVGATRAKLKQKKKMEREEKEQKIIEERERESHTLRLTEYVTTSDLANLMGISPNEIILKCMQLGLMVTINQRLDKDTITVIADDYGFEVEFIGQKEIQFVEEEDDEQETKVPRPPIVTIMGHVDHGKTSLLDFIRHANVVAGEAGGITQHIGAYKVEMPGTKKSITFLDTPGHEAFTAMRARGAQVTDIVVLVVAADDSVMPQTIEAISHAKAANVPIVVAINKIDKPDANPDRIKQQLTDHGILTEDWGGKNQCVEISAKKGINVDLLLEKILLEAEMLDLRANPDRKARGIVVEANMNKGWGPVATVIVRKGTLAVGEPFVAGNFSGRVRAMLDERGNKVEVAGPSTPVMVIGFDGLPEAGDGFITVETDTEARYIANERKQLRREQDLRRQRHITLDEISQQIQLGGVKDLFLVIKGDVSGSVEALSDSLMKLSRDEVRVNILHKGVGTISETDVMLASASNAVIIGFNVTPAAKAKKLAEAENIDIRHYDIIYDCINEIQLALEGLLTPEIKEEITSAVEVRQIFKISRLGTIAGCYVLSGKIARNDKIRVLRDGLPVHAGSLSSLKRGKDDVKEVDTGYECGIQVEGFNDVQEGDIIEGYKLIEVRRRWK